MQLSPLSLRNERHHNTETIEAMLARGGNNFNFLRLILATLVLFSHCFEVIYGSVNRGSEPFLLLTGTLTLGDMAVDGFFLISGFLILRSWLQEPRVWPYLKKRVLRIYPGFIVASLLCLLIVAPIGAHGAAYFAQFSIKSALMNTLLLQQPTGPPFFESLPGQSMLNPSMWTIAYEFRCYLLAAVVGFLVIKKPAYWLFISALLLVLFPWRDAIASFHFPLSYYLFGRFHHFIRLAMFFAMGGCFFLALKRLHFHTPLALACMPLIVIALFVSRTCAEIALATLGAYVLFWFAFLPIPLLNRFKHQSDVSYGLYLYGWPVQRLLQWYLPISSPYSLFLLAFVFSYGCGYLSWIGIEKPALRFKRRTPRDPRIVGA